METKEAREAERSTGKRSKRQRLETVNQYSYTFTKLSLIIMCCVFNVLALENLSTCIFKRQEIYVNVQQPL